MGSGASKSLAAKKLESSSSPTSLQVDQLSTSQKTVVSSDNVQAIEETGGGTNQQLNSDYVHSPVDEVEIAARNENNEMLAYSAMSLDMDNEDLLFNLMYFGGGDNDAIFVDTAITETLAAHSASNTPYKLKPAEESVVSSLPSQILDKEVLQLVDYECSICKDEMEMGCEVTPLAESCGHCFHTECLIRWIKLQGFCPVCRSEIESSSLRSF